MGEEQTGGTKTHMRQFVHLACIAESHTSHLTRAAITLTEELENCSNSEELVHGGGVALFQGRLMF